MKSVHETLEKLDKLGWEDSFQFRCRKELSCWTSCCHNANLFITPYDVLRLKNRLDIRSDEFLEKYADSSIGADFGLPVVRLKMTGEKGACPFVTPDGCSVYSDRPTSCRLYPLGHGVSSGTIQKKGENVFFKIEEEHCLGWKEDKTWTLEEWVLDQGAKEYNYYNGMASNLAFHPKLGAPEAIDEKKLGMIYMATYDLDRFRDFVFESSFLDRFDVEEETIENIRNDDEQLLRFGMRWIDFSVFGKPTVDVKKK